MSSHRRLDQPLCLQEDGCDRPQERFGERRYCPGRLEVHPAAPTKAKSSKAFVPFSPPSSRLKCTLDNFSLRMGLSGARRAEPDGAQERAGERGSHPHPGRHLAPLPGEQDALHTATPPLGPVHHASTTRPDSHRNPFCIRRVNFCQPRVSHHCRLRMPLAKPCPTARGDAPCRRTGCKPTCAAASVATADGG